MLFASEIPTSKAHLLMGLTRQDYRYRNLYQELRIRDGASEEMIKSAFREKSESFSNYTAAEVRDHTYEITEIHTAYALLLEPLYQEFIKLNAIWNKTVFKWENNDISYRIIYAGSLANGKTPEAHILEAVKNQENRYNDSYHRNMQEDQETCQKVNELIFAVEKKSREYHARLLEIAIAREKEQQTGFWGRLFGNAQPENYEASNKAKSSPTPKEGELPNVEPPQAPRPQKKKYTQSKPSFQKLSKRSPLYKIAGVCSVFFATWLAYAYYIKKKSAEKTMPKAPTKARRPSSGPNDGASKGIN